MALYKGTIAYLLKTEDGEISWTVCPKTLLCPNSYGNTIQKGLFNKLKEVPPTGSKRHNRMKNISCRRNIFRLVEREANENWTEHCQLVSHCITLSRVQLNWNYPLEKKRKSTQKTSCPIATVAGNKGIKQIKPENSNGKIVLVFLLQNQL